VTFWRRQSLFVRRLVPAALITILLVGLAAADEIRWTGAAILIVIAVVLLLWRPVREGFWPSVERAGVKDAHARWSEQPSFVSVRCRRS
jgi:hypothetical protein